MLISRGHLAIGLSGFAGQGTAGKVCFFLGLALIVLGTGLLKPNISAIVGDLYPEGGARRDAGFSIFYMGINAGSFFGQIITGLLGENYGYHWGFGAAGVGMLAGLAWFALRANATLGPLGLEPTRDPDPAVQARRERTIKLSVAVGLAVVALVFVLAATGALTLDAVTIAGYMTFILVGLAVVYFAYLFVAGGLTTDEKKRMAVIFLLFVFAALFWAAFEQAPTSLNLFAKDFTRRTIGGFEVPATWFQSVNSTCIVLLAPVMAALWVWMEKRGIALSSPAKFALGLAFAGIGFWIMIYPARAIVAGGVGTLVSPWWLVVSYIFQSIGELSLSPVGLSSMTKLSPRRYVGQMMGVWFLAASVGNVVAGLLGGGVDPENLAQMPGLFKFTTTFLFIAAVACALLIIPIRRMMATAQDRGVA